MKIGIFDSGIGGHSVLYEALSRMPQEEYIFYADTDHVPYGMKSSEEIKGYADAIVSDLIDRGSEAVVIACNTATAVAAETVRKKYVIPIIGMEPAV
jgi:glutamate racemase